MRVLVGITGGIAAYKAAEIVREFVELGHEVRVVTTQNALRFIGAATLEALSHNPVSTDIYSDVSEVRHIELARWAEIVLVAPATASFLARTATGLADDLLGNVILASTAPIFIAPAMHTEMWLNAATISNVQILRARGLTVIEPASGRLTGSDTGIGRLPDAKDIVASVLNAQTKKNDLAGKKVLVVAGGTREFIDPVRFIGNRSSGKQGIALAEVASSRGAQVTLIAANFDYSSAKINVIPATTSLDVQEALEMLGVDFDFVIMPAAISDFKPAMVSETKLKKTGGQGLDLELFQTADLISDLASKLHHANPNCKVIGFAAETASGEELIALGRTKLHRKGLDFVVANDVSGGSGFESDENSVSVLSDSILVSLEGSKFEIASGIFDVITA